MASTVKPRVFRDGERGWWVIDGPRGRSFAITWCGALRRVAELYRAHPVPEEPPC